jgi:hypothetical protein
MAKKAEYFIVSSASRASGTSREIPELASFKRVSIILNVTIAPGTSLDLALAFKDPQTGNYVRVQTRDAGQNANGTHTVGTWALGAFTQVVAATAVPYTAMRALTDNECFPTIGQLVWTVVGANPTFSITLIGETEE